MAKRKVPACKPVKGRAAKVIKASGLSAAKRIECEKAAHLIFTAFCWDGTAEGGRFWEAVYNRLNDIALGAPLK